MDESRSPMDGHRTSCEPQWYNAVDNGSGRWSRQPPVSRASAGAWTMAGSNSHSSTSVRAFCSRDDFDNGNACECEACKASLCQTATMSPFAPNMNTTLNNSMGGGKSFQPRRGDLKQLVRRSKSRNVINTPQYEHRIGRTRPSTVTSLRQPVARDYGSTEVTYRQQDGTSSLIRRPPPTRGDMGTDVTYRRQGAGLISHSSIRRPRIVREDTSEELTCRQPMLKTVASKHTQVPCPTCNNNASTDSTIYIDPGVSNKKRPTRTKKKVGQKSKASATKRRPKVSGRKKANSTKKHDGPTNREIMLEKKTYGLEQPVTNSRRYGKRKPTPKRQSRPPICPQYTSPSQPPPTDSSPRRDPSQHFCNYVPSAQFCPQHCYSSGSCPHSTTAISRTASEALDDSMDECSLPGARTQTSKRRKTKADADGVGVETDEGLSHLLPVSSTVSLSPKSKVRKRSF